jgi:DNA polymerase-1
MAEKHGLSEEYMLRQARLARILRASDYDFKRKEPILWLPPRNP